MYDILEVTAYMFTNTSFDKSLISFIISPIVGILVMKGIIAPAYADQVVQQTELWIGASIFLGGLLIGVLHHTAIQQNQTNQLTAEEEEIIPATLPEPNQTTTEPASPTSV